MIALSLSARREGNPRGKKSRSNLEFWRRRTLLDIERRDAGYFFRPHPVRINFKDSNISATCVFSRNCTKQMPSLERRVGQLPCSTFNPNCRNIYMTVREAVTRSNHEDASREICPKTSTAEKRILAVRVRENEGC